MLERAGKISNLLRQVTIPLGASGRVKYRADFVYFDEVKKSWVIFIDSVSGFDGNRVFLCARHSVGLFHLFAEPFDAAA